MNAFAERWVRSVKQECLSKLIFFGESALRRALTEYTEHYHTGRAPHESGPQRRVRDVIAGPLCETTRTQIAAALKDETVTITKARLAFNTFRVVKNQQRF